MDNIPYSKDAEEGSEQMCAEINHPELCCSCRYKDWRDLGYDWCSIRQTEPICIITEKRTHSNCGNTQMLFLDNRADKARDADVKTK